VLIAWAYWYTRQPEKQAGASVVAEKIKPLINQ
jgi:predicted negative regulator of RcsB-dependent stress response